MSSKKSKSKERTKSLKDEIDLKKAIHSFYKTSHRYPLDISSDYETNPDNIDELRAEVIKIGKETKDIRTVKDLIYESPLRIWEIFSSPLSDQIRRDIYAKYKFYDALAMWMGQISIPDFAKPEEIELLIKTAKWYIDERKSAKEITTEKLINSTESRLIKLYEKITGNKVEHIVRRSKKEFDVFMSGHTPKGFGFQAWLPLATIYISPWQLKEIYKLSDYPEELEENKDWSFIRDSSEYAIWRMFEQAKKILKFE